MVWTETPRHCLVQNNGLFRSGPFSFFQRNLREHTCRSEIPYMRVRWRWASISSLCVMCSTATLPSSSLPSHPSISCLRWLLLLLSRCLHIAKERRGLHCSPGRRGEGKGGKERRERDDPDKDGRADLGRQSHRGREERGRRSEEMISAGGRGEKEGGGTDQDIEELPCFPLLPSSLLFLCVLFSSAGSFGIKKALGPQRGGFFLAGPRLVLWLAYHYVGVQRPHDKG